MRIGLLALSIVAFCVPWSAAGEESPIGRKVDDFTLRDFRGKEHSLSDLQQKPVVAIVFLGTECPLAKLYAPRLQKLAKEYDPKGVAFLGVNANVQDSVTEIAHQARVAGIEFPMLKDVGNVLADRIGALRTPEVFLLDKDRVVRYWGRIDDQYGLQTEGRGSYQQSAPRHQDMVNAINELLAGKTVRKPVVKAPGCLIGRAREADASSPVTYAGDVAKILNQRCVSCHRPGQIAPFALTNYDEVAGWAEMIQEVVGEGRMPPWHADPKIGDFSNDCRLADDEKATIFAWVKAGAPAGDLTKAPAVPSFPEGWMIPEPDQVIYMNDEGYEVPAEGTVAYQRFVVDPGWKEDKWVKAIEPKPSNPAVVHHIIIYLRPPSGVQTGPAGRLRTDWLAAYAPGLRQQVLPDGMARYIPAGTQFVFELHYTPNGVAQKDRSFVGICFADPKTVKKEVAVKNAGNFTFTIPPGDENHEVESNYTFREDAILLSVSPHMHLRGKDFRYDLKLPDGKTETLLWVPKYDFGWQTTYMLREPRLVPKGAQMRCVAHFDNSENNLANPDPSTEVRWGEQTWEEMMFGWFEIAPADQDLSKPQPPPKSRVKQFAERIDVEGKRLGDQLTHAAGRWRHSDLDFEALMAGVMDAFPQVDRVCVTYVKDGKLRLVFARDMNGFKGTLRSKFTVLPIEGESLAEIIHAGKPTTIPDVSTTSGALMSRMAARGVRSSLHVPVTINGKEASINFWSKDAVAFPPAAADLLAELARLMAKEKK